MPPPAAHLPYRALLTSILALIAREPVLRQRMTLGALQMAGFAVLWTSIAFLLSGPPFHYATATIGLFAIAGLAGAGIAPLAGRLTDRGYARTTTTAFLFAILAGWALLAAGRTSAGVLLAGIVVLDFGIQGAQITHQSAIYTLHPDARSRLITAYISSMFLGGVAGSAAAGTVYDRAQWTATCLLGGALATTALVVWLTSRRPRRTTHTASDLPGERGLGEHGHEQATDRPEAQEGLGAGLASRGDQVVALDVVNATREQMKRQLAHINRLSPNGNSTTTSTAGDNDDNTKPQPQRDVRE